MSEAVQVFVQGTVGVFAGMAFVYATIRISAVLVGRWTREKGE